MCFGSERSKRRPGISVENTAGQRRGGGVGRGEKRMKIRERGGKKKKSAGHNG